MRAVCASGVLTAVAVRRHMQDHDRFEGKKGLWREVQRRRYQLYNREYIAFLATTGGGIEPMVDDHVRHSHGRVLTCCAKTGVAP